MGNSDRFSFWANKCLNLPRLVATAFVDELNARGLWPVAIGQQGSGVIGGVTSVQADQHFALRFGNSSSRVVAVVIDPEKQFNTISRDITETCSGGTVRLLDLACGSGAVSSTLVTTLVERRQSEELPTLPLNLHIIGADVSGHSLGIYDAVMNRIAAGAQQCGIHLTWETVHWDATQADQTSLLCDQWLSGDANEFFVCVANLSGAGTARFRSFERSFQHIGERMTGRSGILLWIEPGTDKARTFVRKVKTFFRQHLPWFVHAEKGKKPAAWTYAWMCPVKAVPVQSSVTVDEYQRQ